MQMVEEQILRRVHGTQAKSARERKEREGRWNHRKKVL